MTKQNKGRRRLIAWTLGVSLWLLLALWLTRESSEVSDAHAPRTEQGLPALGSTRVPAVPVTTRRPLGAAGDHGSVLGPVPPESLVVSQATLIGEVTLERSEVCPHEDLTITMAPVSGAEGTSFNIEGRFGSTVVVSPSMPVAESFWIVAAHGNRRDFREVVVKVLPEEHPRCARAPRAELTWELDPWQPGKVTFEVVPVRNLLDIAAVRWSYGDGAQHQGGARSSHVYKEDQQPGPHSTFLVGAEAVDTQGQVVSARTSVSLPNLHRQARALSGYRGLPVAYDRFAAVGGARHVPVSVDNLEESPVRFERAEVRLFGCDGTEHTIELAASALLDPPELPAQRLSETRITLDASWVGAETCHLELALSGDTVPPTSGRVAAESGIPNLPVTASFRFELGMPNTAEEGVAPALAARPVTDPQLEAKLLELIEELGRNYVTQEELDRAGE